MSPRMLPVAGAFVAAGWAWYTGAGACEIGSSGRRVMVEGGASNAAGAVV